MGIKMLILINMMLFIPGWKLHMKRNKKLNWKQLINPDLSFPEAYINGDIKIENGSLLDFLNLTFENLGRGEINASGYLIKKLLHVWRYFTNYNITQMSY